MSEVLTARERELQDKLRQKDQELRQANGELEERGKLLYKTKVAIEQLQQELAASRKEEENIRLHANRIYEEHAAHLREAEDHIQRLEEELGSESQKAADFQAQVHILEEELDSYKGDQQQGVSNSKLREKDRIIDSLKDDISILQEQLAPLERLVQETTAALNDQKEMAAAFQLDKDEADRLVQELMAKNHRLQDENQKLQREIKDMKNTVAVKEQDAASAMVTAELSKKEVAALERDWQKRLTQAESDWRQKLADAMKRVEEGEQQIAACREAAHKADYDWQGRHRDADREWEKRLQDCMLESERKLAAERKDWEQRFADMEKQWLARVQENEQLWSTQLTDDQKLWEQERSDIEVAAQKQREELDQQYNRHVDELKAATTKKTTELEAKAASEKALLEKLWSKKLEDVDRSWKKKLEENSKEWSNQVDSIRRQMSADKTAWLAADADNEKKWQYKVEDLRRRAQEQDAEKEALWAQKFEAAHQRWLKEREDLDAAWSQRLAELQTAAQARYNTLRVDLETKLQSITERLGEMARREAKREKKRAELSRQVEELTISNEEEFQKRCDLERTLREAAAIFKRELYDKEEAVAAAHAELRVLRDWQGRSFDHLPQYDGHQAQTQYLRAGSASPASPHPHHTTTQHSALPRVQSPAAPSPYRSQYSPRQSPGPSPAPGAMHAPAPAPVERELRALRLAREEYQHALLEQERIRNKLLSSIEKKLEERDALASAGRARSPRAARSPAAPAHRTTQASHQQRRQQASPPRQASANQRYSSPRRKSSARRDSPPPTSSRSSETGTTHDESMDFETWHRHLSQQLGGAAKNLEPTLLSAKW